MSFVKNNIADSDSLEEKTYNINEMNHHLKQLNAHLKECEYHLKRFNFHGSLLKKDFDDEAAHV